MPIYKVRAQVRMSIVRQFDIVMDERVVLLYEIAAKAIQAAKEQVCGDFENYELTDFEIVESSARPIECDGDGV